MKLGVFSVFMPLNPIAVGTEELIVPAFVDTLKHQFVGDMSIEGDALSIASCVDVIEKEILPCY